MAKSFRLEGTHGGLIKKVIIIIVIALVVLWFVNRQVVFDLYDWIRNLVGSFF